MRMKTAENMAESSASNIEDEPQAGERRQRKRTRISLDFEDVDTESPASLSDEDEAQSVPLRGRGRGRGRGSVRGRGRGGRRGGRVFRARQFEEGEEERLVRLHEERQETANEMIDSLTEDESKAMLKEIANRQPALILDIAGILSRRQQSDEPSSHESPGPADPQPSQPSWCVCRKCPPMDRDEDKVCCGMAPQFCNSMRPEMGLVVTDPLTLHIQQVFRNDVFVQEASSLEDTNKSMRHAAYRQYILWLYGRLERDDRRTVPACCVKIIREKFPSPSGHYTGFIPAQHGIGW